MQVKGRAGTKAFLVAQPTQHAAGAMGATVLTVLVSFVYLAVGLTGHDPWKQDETYIFGVIQSFLESGDWVVPMVAGEPFMEKPPLYYWVAAFLARCFSPWLALHDGARLATGFFMTVTCLVLGWTTRTLWGQKAANAAVLLLLACFGTAMYAHMMVTDIPVMSGIAFAAAGFIAAQRRAGLGGCLLGVGVSIGFLGKGLLLPGVIGVTGLLLPTVFRAWRTPAYVRTCGIAVLASLPALMIWPVALYVRSPALFHEWFWMNNIGRFLGFSVAQLGAPNRPGYWLQTIAWFTFPALPFALATLWKNRLRFRQDAALQFLVTCSIVFIVILVASASARESYALPLLIPLCMLAAPGVTQLPRRTDRLWMWGSAILFGTVASFLWAVWIMAYFGVPPGWPWLAQRIFVDPSSAVYGLACMVAAALTAAVIVSVIVALRTGFSGLITWVSGLLLCWGLLMTLWLPWIESAKSYRSVFLSMSQAMRSSMLPANACVESVGLGESERAMLKYVLGITTRRYEIVGPQQCALLLVDGLAASPPTGLEPAAWNLIWSGAREHDYRERFWLYARIR